MFSYATPSVFRSDLERATLGFACDQARPLSFRGKLVRHIPIFRFALRALGQLIWSSDDDSRTLDPIVTVHPDRLIFEAFSSDLSSYGCLSIDVGNFALEGTPQWGTSNVDFTAWLWGALGELRQSRETTLTLGPQGLGLETVGAGGRFEPKVEVPEEWFRAFLEVQSAMTRPAIQLLLRPVDLLAPVRFLRYTKSRVSPRALRYELRNGQWSIILEPWEEVFPLRHKAFGQDPRVIRTWGRQRLRLIEPLLPFATGVEITLLGRALPHFYRVDLPGMAFTLGLTGWGRQRFQQEAGYSLWQGLPQAVCENELEARRSELEQLRSAPPHPLDPELVRRGLAMYDLQARVYRYRPLTQQPLDLSKIYGQTDPRQERAASLQSEVTSCHPQETRKIRRLPGPNGSVEREVILRDWKVLGTCEGHNLELVVSEQEQILFGRCGCEFFQKNLLQQGPCEHLLSLFEASRSQRLDLPSSIAITVEKASEDKDGE